MEDRCGLGHDAAGRLPEARAAEAVKRCSRQVGLLLTLGCLLVTATAHAQTDSLRTRRMELLRRVPSGTLLRVQTGSERLIGSLQRVQADTLYLDGRVLPASSLDAIWLQQRATRRG